MTTFIIDLTARLRGRHPAGRRLVPGVVERVGRAEFETGVHVAPVEDDLTIWERAGVNRPDVIPMERRRKKQPVCQRCLVEEATQLVKGQRRCQFCTFGGDVA